MLETCQSETEDAISLTAKARYEKNKELLISLIKLRDVTTDVLPFTSVVAPSEMRLFLPANIPTNEVDYAYARRVFYNFGKTAFTIYGREVKSYLGNLLSIADEVEAAGWLEQGNSIASVQPAQDNNYKERQSKEIELTDTEGNILEALGDKIMRGQELLKKTGYDYSGHYRGILSNLVKRKILESTRDGYRRVSDARLD